MTVERAIGQTLITCTTDGKNRLPINCRLISEAR